MIPGNAITKISDLLFGDLCSINVFDDLSCSIVKRALQKALTYIKCHSKPVFYHYDLFAQNVFAEEYNNEVHLGCIIDFGMSFLHQYTMSSIIQESILILESKILT
jgi:hypothetical protein